MTNRSLLGLVAAPALIAAFHVYKPEQDEVQHRESQSRLPRLENETMKTHLKKRLAWVVGGNRSLPDIPSEL
jgi:hypothetical protein